MAFAGAVLHFCLGAHPARREITAMLGELMRRVLTIRPAGRPDRLLSSFINGIEQRTRPATLRPRLLRRQRT